MRTRIILFLGVVWSCSAPSPPPIRTYTADVEASRLSAHSLAQELSASGSDPVCTSSPAVEVVLHQAVLVVTAGTCYSCKGVGRLVRNLARVNRSRSLLTSLVIPSSDIESVCEFLGREKATGAVPVFAAPDSSFAAANHSRLLSYFEILDGDSITFFVASPKLLCRPAI